MLANALIIGFAPFLVRFIASEALFQHAKRKNGMIHFPVGIGLRIIFRLGGPMLIFIGYKMIQQASTMFDQTTAMLVAAIGIGCLLGEPGEILTAPDGLVQKAFLGMRRRTIAWNGAVASHPVRSKEVLVVGSDGTTITHSAYHVGQEEFVEELMRHAVYVQS